MVLTQKVESKSSLYRNLFSRGNHWRFLCVLPKAFLWIFKIVGVYIIFHTNRIIYFIP